MRDVTLLARKAAWGWGCQCGESVRCLRGHPTESWSLGGGHGLLWAAAALWQQQDAWSPRGPC